MVPLLLSETMSPVVITPCFRPSSRPLLSRTTSAVAALMPASPVPVTRPLFTTVIVPPPPSSTIESMAFGAIIPDASTVSTSPALRTCWVDVPVLIVTDAAATGVARPPAMMSVTTDVDMRRREPARRGIGRSVGSGMTILMTMMDRAHTTHPIGGHLGARRTRIVPESTRSRFRAYVRFLHQRSTRVDSSFVRGQPPTEPVSSCKAESHSRQISAPTLACIRSDVESSC